MRRSVFATLGVATVLLATACVTVPPSAKLPASAAHRPPAHIDRTGATDVTAKLQAFLNGVPDGAKVLFDAGARYRIEGTLRLDWRDGLTLDGNGATFFATQTGHRTRSQWDLQNVSNTVVENMIIKGAHPNGGVEPSAQVSALEAQHGINIAGGERITIRNNRITDVYGDFVYVGRSARPAFGIPTQIRIHDNFMRRNGRSGISMTNGDDIVIRHNDIAQTRRSTFNMEPNVASGVVHNVTIRHNNVGPGRLNFVAAHGSGTVDDVSITDNVLRNKTMGMSFAAREGTRRSLLTIARNRSDTSAGAPTEAVIRLLRLDHVVVQDNVQPVDKGRNMHMVELRDSCQVTVKNNDLGPFGAGQMFVNLNNYDCSLVPHLL